MSQIGNVDNLKDVEMEYRDMVDKKKLEAEYVEEWDKKQMVNHRKKDRMKRDTIDHKTEDINSGKLNGETSYNTSPNNVKMGVSPVIKPELSNGKTNVNSDDCGREESLFKTCLRKRKRHFCECDNYISKFQGSGLTCVGILPGLKSIIESSDDSDQSCSGDSENNENNKYDLLGRKIVCVENKSLESK